MVVPEDEVGPPAARPWWFAPAVTAVVIGAIAGIVVTEPPPACSTPDASVEVVVGRFLSRFGSSARALRDCFTPGRPTDVELQGYVAARPPTTYRIAKISEASDAQGRAHFAAAQVIAVWDGEPPERWDVENFQWVVLRRTDDRTRWMIEETRPPYRR